MVLNYNVPCDYCKATCEVLCELHGSNPGNKEHYVFVCRDCLLKAVNMIENSDEEGWLKLVGEARKLWAKEENEL